MDFLFDPANGLLSDDHLTIYAEISYVGEMANLDELPDQVELEKQSQLQVMKDLHLWLENGKLADVILVVEGKEFYTHKAILGARSPVFAAMFEVQSSKEKLSCSRQHIIDIELDVFEHMLNYIYSGMVGDMLKLSLNQMADKLFLAANKVIFDLFSLYCFSSHSSLLYNL